MSKGQHTGMGRALALAAGVLCLLASGCEQPSVGARTGAAAPTEGPRIAIEDATVDLHGHVVVTFSASEEGLPLALAEVTALAPRFTLASLGVHPVDGIRAWRSQILNGKQVATRLPPSGPGTPPALELASARQPGFETPASLVDLGGGTFRYVYESELTGFDPDDTLRVGVYLSAAPRPSLKTAGTHDFRPSGGPMVERETVLDRNCTACHGVALVHHDGRAGVKLCETCHTWQNADPDTLDPAALWTTAAAARAANPNPLELGRLVHRLHRGAKLPTLHAASTRVNPETDLGLGVDMPLPYSPELIGSTGLVGRKYSIVGEGAVEFIAGRIIQRTDNGLPLKTVQQGIAFPRDYRDCGVCHAGAPQAVMVSKAISRRLCAGCHPDTWFQPTPALLDEGHFPHPGNSQDDDTRCAGCHVEATGGSTLYAPIEELHVHPLRSPRNGQPRIELVRISGMTPGGRPSITYRVHDRLGAIGPTLGAPVPAWEPDGPSSSLVGRRFASFTIIVAGPTVPDYDSYTTSLLTSGTRYNNPDPLTIGTAAASDDYVYTFSSTLPLSASGTWAVSVNGARQRRYPHFDKGTNTFPWPGTGETVREIPENPIAYVNTATGTWDALETPPSPGAVPRRKVVDVQNCNRCHERIALHGSRNQVEFCLFCHNPSRTDFSGRTKNASGYVDFSTTLDGIEERSIQLKTMIHRLHTGEHKGSASLEGIAPFVIGRSYFDEVRYPGDLANCTLCHVAKTFRLENVPPYAPPTLANETGVAMHQPLAIPHPPEEQGTPPLQAACTSCHANGATFSHVAAKTTNGGESCPSCHAKGAQDVEVAHGLAPRTTQAATASFASILQNVLVPRCAGTACHSTGGVAPILETSTAYGALVGVTSGQASPELFVEPGAPEKSFLVKKLRGTAGVGLIMPTDGALAPADLAAIEAWISNGAPND